MAHFAKVENGYVVDILVVPDENEANGEQYLHDLGFAGRWLQASYNTHNGVHSEGKEPLRYNYPGIGYLYDESADAFYLPSPFPSWSLDENFVWQPPVDYPEEGGPFVWDETEKNWIIEPDYEVE